ncbi:hypothetical protein BJ138DRAFT_1106585 [Hygrophoropsis aurantiaca]|uniref:Uncharacterized protein n=1 Tax=Hygrophoropsis aurantiaca TaxID=72124 RepID=A0ACB7ZUJ1_9AGAM|nr:hypothetical protein BJ138DRAFT_1106585 [Hygrophoropsis aurantiaca]
MSQQRTNTFESGQNTYQVLNYRVDLDRPTVTTMPVEHDALAPFTPDDLAMGDVIRQGPASARVINPRNKTYTCLPNSSSPLQYPFTFILDHPAIAIPNNCIQTLFLCSFRGNVLVAKTSHDMVLRDVEEDDIPLIDAVLACAIRRKEL